jgi:tetratricopeptide (TPR) repeat protein
MSSREYNEAIKCFDEAIRFKPNDSVAYHLKGLCLQFLQDYAEAIRCFDNALKVRVQQLV